MNHQYIQTLIEKFTLTAFHVAFGISLYLISGCSYPNQFVNVEKNKPHAVLTADKGEGWRDSGPGVFNINNQPTSFWRMKEYFRIPTGRTNLDVIAAKEPYDFNPITFNAHEGRHYHLRYSDNRSSVTLYDITDASRPTFVTKSPRQKTKNKNKQKKTVLIKQLPSRSRDL